MTPKQLTETTSEPPPWNDHKIDNNFMRPRTVSRCGRWLSRVLTRSTRGSEEVPYHVNALKPHFYIVKLNFTGTYIIFLLLL